MIGWADALKLSNGRGPQIAPVSSEPIPGHRAPNGCGCGGAAPASQYAPPMNGETNTGGCGGACSPSPSPQISCGGSVVQGSALGSPLDSGWVNIRLKDCREPVLVTCPSHEFFKISSRDRLIRFYDFTTCDFEDDPSPGGCPTSYAQPYAIETTTPGDFTLYIDLPDGTYQIEEGGTNDPPVFTRVDCPPAACKKYPLKWETDDNGDVIFVVTGPLNLTDLDVEIVLCNPGA